MKGIGKSVYILGAGASAASDFRLPVMSGFFRNEEPSLVGVEDYLKFVFGTADVTTLNLEDVLTHMDLMLEGIGARWARSFGRTREREIRNQVIRYVMERLHIPAGGTCTKHVSLIELLKDGDSILNLNYDLVCDNAIAKAGAKSAVRRSAYLARSQRILGEEAFLGSMEKHGVYLKLHGSLNWYVCPVETCPSRGQFFLIPDGAAGRGPFLCTRCGNPWETVIIPPVIGKAVERIPKMGLIWHLAYRELVEADRIIVIGCSLPPSDYSLRWLVRASQVWRNQSRISEERSDWVPLALEIVNRDPKVVDSMRSLFLTESEPIHFVSLDEFLSRQDQPA